MRAIITADRVLAHEELRKLCTWGSDFGEVHPEIASRDGRGGADGDVRVAAPVVVEKRLAVVGAVPPARDDGPGLRLRRVQDPVGGADDGVRSELIDELEEAALSEAHRADLGREVAQEVPGVPDVDGRSSA